MRAATNRDTGYARESEFSSTYDRTIMAKKSKISEVKPISNDWDHNKATKVHSHSTKKHESTRRIKEDLEFSDNETIGNGTSLNVGSYKKRPPQVYYEKIVESINDWYSEKKQKSKPDAIYRKHIPWKEVVQSMVEKGYSVKDVNDLKHNWFEICRHIKVERPLSEILLECHSAIEKLFKIPTQSGYGIYQTEQRHRIRQKYPEMKFIEIHQKIAKRWNKFTDEQKQHYNDLAAKENEKNGVGSDRTKRKRKAKSTEEPHDETYIIENYNYPTTVLRDFYVSYKAAELKKIEPDLPYKKRRSLAGLSFSRCSFEELTEIKKKYAEHLQQFVNRIKSDHPELIDKIGHHIMVTKRLRPLLEQPIISKFLSNINLSEIDNNDTHDYDSKKLSISNSNVESSPSSSPLDKQYSLIERIENSYPSSDESSG